MASKGSGPLCLWSPLESHDCPGRSGLDQFPRPEPWLSHLYEDPSCPALGMDVAVAMWTLSDHSGGLALAGLPWRWQALPHFSLLRLMEPRARRPSGGSLVQQSVMEHLLCTMRGARLTGDSQSPVPTLDTSQWDGGT